MLFLRRILFAVPHIFPNNFKSFSRPAEFSTHQWLFVSEVSIFPTSKLSKVKTDSRKDSAGEKVSSQSGRQKSCGGKTTTAEGVYFTSASTASDKIEHFVTTIPYVIM